jgi:hypothetical protein
MSSTGYDTDLLSPQQLHQAGYPVPRVLLLEADDALYARLQDRTGIAVAEVEELLAELA